jgi:hypothetical protein
MDLVAVLTKVVQAQQAQLAALQAQVAALQVQHATASRPPVR